MLKRGSGYASVRFDLFLLQWLTGGPLPAGVVVGVLAMLLQLASARLFYLQVFVQRAGGRSSRFSIVALHDGLHGVSN
ncbi:hypothetical protein OGR47_19335 (plasmid) [Methylocystis sp. MJC1]|jgi:hypothetical protein|uniref:hypothetical protein n=1 Tax=Methylocystis sp. MJC1 TaxID=2654282 RepID=UPI0013EB1BF1|nr:hypothetical protein [Methylocystis sp. MJC1]KAF2988920.1 hypothetical protein MJC1_04013 [Methylocystis sp. MJC1]MBU6529095.1 hypothetical protein [Methylocystis sp. MJC1]UZX14034.1 hypothetical protein OGR47_19335 [Methylocystis sp. MJC1]